MEVCSVILPSAYFTAAYTYHFRSHVSPNTTKPLREHTYPHYDLSSPNMRCGRDAMTSGPQSEVATIMAGEKVGFRLDLWNLRVRCLQILPSPYHNKEVLIDCIRMSCSTKAPYKSTLAAVPTKPPKASRNMRVTEIGLRFGGRHRFRIGGGGITRLILLGRGRGMLGM